MGQAVRTGMVLSVRRRFTIAQVNAGATIVADVPGMKHRLVGATMIAVGGAVGAVTTVDINGILSGSSRKLATFAQAQLTQSTPLRLGDTGVTLLADGASFTQNDADTALSIGKTGDDITTATHIDVLLQYAAEETASQAA